MVREMENNASCDLEDGTVSSSKAGVDRGNMENSGVAQGSGESPVSGPDIALDNGYVDQVVGVLRYSSDLGMSGLNGLDAGSPSRPSLGHCKTAPVRSSSSNQLLDSSQLALSRFKTGKKEPKLGWKLDKLSEHEKKMILENVIKIRNNGTVEVDVTGSEPVASELLELDAVDTTPIQIKDTAELTKSVPRLKIVILVVGTRGDVQPFLAFAKRLKEFGHRVRLATHVNFSNFVKSAGVEFYPLGGDPRIMARYMAKTRGFVLSGPSEISQQRKQLKAVIDSIFPACTEPDLDSGIPFKAQAIIANPPAYGHAHIAEALGAPLHIFFTMPWTPTHEFPHPLARVPQSAAYRLSYLVVDLIVWWGIRSFINDFRKKKLKLAPIAYFSTYHGSISHLPTGYMWSPHIVPKPKDWGPLVDVVGYCFLNHGTKYKPPKEFEDWIQLGPKPIYIGFGSMPLEDVKGTTSIILEALKETGQRGIIGRGWGDLGTLLQVPKDVFLLEDCPHDWLFPQCSAVVHHGGAGTTATGLRAACPTTIVPFFGDQFFWGDRVYEKGVGPAPIPISELTVERLANAIRFMLESEVKLRALDLAQKIGNEDGVAAAVSAFHRHLPSELPLRPATLDDDDDDQHPSPFKWILHSMERWCCFPCFW